MKSQTQNMMKQFNLEEYLANPSKKVVTRDGRNVRIICTDHDNISYPIVGAIKGHDFPFCFGEDGYVVGSKCNDANDLFFAPEKHEGWVNIYKAGVQRETLGCLVTRYVGSCIWPTEGAAKTAADPEPIATIKIEWEE